MVYRERCLEFASIKRNNFKLVGYIDEAVLSLLLYERGNITSCNRTQYRSPRVEGVNCYAIPLTLRPVVIATCVIMYASSQGSV